MKADFFQPRFIGPRFEEHTIPLEIARDLGSYEVLVVELAKHLFLDEHPERQRVPKGFSADFHLHLSRVDDGSAKPLLSLVTAGALLLGDGVNPYFERARDLITQCVAGTNGQLPPEFPKELLSHFNHVGRSLRENEAMEFPVPGGTVAVLTPARRKQLVLAIDKVYEREIDLTGTIGEADWERSTFRLRSCDDSSIVIPMPHSFHDQARKYGGKPRHQVAVKGVGTFDSWDRLQKVVTADSIEVQPDFILSARFDGLALLKDGWFDGRGKGLYQDQLANVSTRMVGHFPNEVPLPTIVPTPEGDLLFEWDLPGCPSIDLCLSDSRAEFHAFTEPDGELEREFLLSSDKEWKDFFEFLIEQLGQASA